MLSKKILIIVMIAVGLSITGCERNKLATSGSPSAVAGSGFPISLILPLVSSISFIDADLDEDQIAGTVTLSKASDETAIISYLLCWGIGPDTKTGSPIAEIPKNGSDPTYQIPVDTVVPAGVTHFIVHTKNAAGEISLGTSLNIPDTVVKVINIFAGTGSSLPDSLIVYNNKLFFVATDQPKDRELWTYDDSTQQKKRVSDLNKSGDMTTGSIHPVIYNNKLYFEATDGVTGEELYVYDDTTQTGPTLVQDINPGAAPSYPGNFVEYAGKLYFGAEKIPGNRQLWLYDDKIGPPAVEIIINPLGDAGVSRLAVHNGKLFFNAQTAITGPELWYFDGISAKIAADLNPGTIGSNPDNLTVFGNDLYFSADDGTNGVELVRYDDASATATVLDIEPGGSSSPGGFTIFNNILFFTATRTSGTKVGTELFAYAGSGSPYLAADIQPGAPSGSPGNYIAYEGRLFFGGNDGVHGNELMVFDGSNPPYTIADINPAGGSDPKDFAVYNGKLYFEGLYDSTKGTELLMYYEK